MISGAGAPLGRSTLPEMMVVVSGGLRGGPVWICQGMLSLS